MLAPLIANQSRRKPFHFRYGVYARSVFTLHARTENRTLHITRQAGPAFIQSHTIGEKKQGRLGRRARTAGVAHGPEPALTRCGCGRPGCRSANAAVGPLMAFLPPCLASRLGRAWALEGGFGGAGPPTASRPWPLRAGRQRAKRRGVGIRSAGDSSHAAMGRAHGEGRRNRSWARPREWLGLWLAITGPAENSCGTRRAKGPRRNSRAQGLSQGTPPERLRREGNKRAIQPVFNRGSGPLVPIAWAFGPPCRAVCPGP